MAPRPLTVWITRAEPGASATSGRVAALGHRPLVAPLLRIEPVADAVADLDGVAALAFTSANGVRAFAERSGRRDLKVFAVGGGTAEAAKAAGFRSVLSADGDVAALAARIAARAGELKGTVLHPGAVEPAGDLAGALAAVGVPARSLALYDSAPAAPPADLLEDLARVDVVLVHSPRAARALAAVLRRRDAAHLRLLCLSAAVARPLARAKVREVARAPFPIEAALLNLIGRGEAPAPPPAASKRRKSR
ncbi:MAG: uroporphyrinogen-III synthase [Pseudomonadota bacterium]